MDTEKQRAGGTPTVARPDRAAEPRPALFTPDDVKGEYQRDLGAPGEFPYTRGIYPKMYTEVPWRMIQQAGYGTSDQTNERFKFFLREGAHSASVTFDMPTVSGLDSDHPMAEGEVGQVGQPIDTLDDMRRLIDGVPLERVHIAMLASHQGAPVIFSMFVEAAVEAGYAPQTLRGTIQNEFLSYYEALPRATAYQPAAAVRIVADTIAYCEKHLPSFIPVNITAEIARELGASVYQELAFTMANGMAYVEAALGKGVDLNRVGPQLAFYMGVHNNFFEEVAKYRAARRMWARIMKERFGATNPKAWRFRVHAQENASTCTAQQPHINIARGTVQAMAAVFGGVQSLQVNPFDEALAIPTEASNRIALRTQQILVHESGLADVIDPLGGSYYVEWLTDHVEEEAQKILDLLESWGNGSMVGGVLHGIETGYFEQAITAEAYAHQCAVEAEDKVVVGVNRFVEGDEQGEVALTQVGPELEALQRQRLAAFKAKRSEAELTAALGAVGAAAAGDDNLIGPIRAAVRVGATLGETCTVLREALGVWRR